MLILLVENNRFHASVLCRMLLKAGFNTIGHAESGIDSLRQTQNGKTDVVILDEAECFSNGTDVIKTIRSTSPETSIIVLTSEEPGINLSYDTQQKPILYFPKNTLTNEDLPRALYDIYAEKLKISNKPLQESAFSCSGTFFTTAAYL